jgi:cytoskeleton protein RodZ
MVNAPVDPSPPMGGGSPVGPGERGASERASVENVSELVAARERAGMSSADIVSLLKMAPRQVDALERGDWAALPGLAFVRGALRSYGRAVGVTVDPLLASLDSGARASELRPSTSLQEPLPSRSMLGFGSGGSGSKTTWVFLAAILLIALALFFGRDTDFSRIPSLLQSTPKPACRLRPRSGGSDGGSRTTVESIPVLPQPSGAPASPSSPGGSAPGQGAPAPGSGSGPAPGSSVSPGSPGSSSTAGGLPAGSSSAQASPAAAGLPRADSPSASPSGAASGDAAAGPAGCCA